MNIDEQIASVVILFVSLYVIGYFIDKAYTKLYNWMYFIEDRDEQRK